MPILKSAKYIIRKIERFLIYRVMSLDDTPHRLALGCAIGIFVTWTPTMGLQMTITIIISFLMRANKFVGVPFVWISNPLTIIPIYGPNYLIGCWMLGNEPGENWKALLEVSSTGTWWERMGDWFQSILPIFWELWIGSLVVATVLGVATYFIMYHLIIFYRKKLNLLHLGKDSAETPESETTAENEEVKEE